MAANQIILFQSSDGVVSLSVQLESESVWLTQAQMAQLFGKDRMVIGKHIRNAIREGEVDASTGCANFAYPEENATGVVKVAAYNLDFIISVGYRVHSLRGVEFRRWATSVLKEYVLRGYAINRKRLVQLGQAVEVMKRVSNSLDTAQVLDVVKMKRKDGSKRIADHTLVALTVMIAESKPAEKEMMVNLVMNFLS